MNEPLPVAAEAVPVPVVHPDVSDRKQVARAVAVCGAVARLYKRHGAISVVQSGEAARAAMHRTAPHKPMHYPLAYRGKRLVR